MTKCCERADNPEGTKKRGPFILKGSRALVIRFILFPFYSSHGLGGEIVEDPVDALDLVGDAVGDALEDVPVDSLDGRRHGVARVDRADDDRPFPDSVAVLDPGGLDRRDDGEILPDLALITGFRELLSEYRVRLSDRLEPVAGDRADAAYAKPRSRERLTLDHGLGQTELSADHTDLVFKEDADGLYQLKFEIVGQTAGVVVRLDAFFALEDVRPDGALREELHVVELARLLGEDLDELAADDLPLLLGIVYARQLVEETVDRVDVDEVGVHLLAEDPDDLLGLSFAQEAVIDVDADEVLTDGSDEQRGDDGRIDAAGQREKDLAGADLGFDIGDLLVDKGFRELGSRYPLHIVGTNECGHWEHLQNMILLYFSPPRTDLQEEQSIKAIVDKEDKKC